MEISKVTIKNVELFYKSRPKLPNMEESITV